MQDMALETKRFLAGSPLRRPANAVIFALIFLFLLGVGAYNLIWPLYGGSVRMIQAFIVGTIIAAICSVPAIFVVWFLDRRQHDSPLLLMGAAMWGAIVSASMSLVFNNSLYGFILSMAKQSGGTVFGISAETFASVFTSPLVEELVKGVAIFVLFWLLHTDFTDLRDGVLFGAMVGLGFNAGQYTIFLLDEYAASGTPPFLSLAALQFVFLGVNGHFIYSALMGAGFGLARQTHTPRMKWLAPLVGIGLAIFANMLANSLGTKVINEVVRALTGQRLLFASTPTVIVWYATALGTLASQFWAYILLGIGIFRNEKWEIETIRQELVDEVNTYVTPEEYVLIEEEVPFVGRTIPGYPSQVAHAIMHAQNELAYRKWHVDKEGESVEDDELVKAWRARISQLRLETKEE